MRGLPGLPARWAGWATSARNPGALLPNTPIGKTQPRCLSGTSPAQVPGGCLDTARVGRVQYRIMRAVF
jgi:hypothetical protein